MNLYNNNVSPNMNKPQESFEIFNDAIQSEASRKYYIFYLKKFLGHTEVKDYDSLAHLKPADLELKVIQYVRYLKRKVEHGVISPNGFRGRTAPIELFFNQNDIVINWKKIKKMFPRREKKKGDIPYNLEDLKALLESATSPRNKALISFFTSNGVRPASIVNLSRENLKEMSNGCASVLIYKDDIEEYPVFLTPEAYKYLQDYFKDREFHGEKLKPTSPLFRNDYGEGTAWRNVKSVTEVSLYTIIVPLLKKAKIRSKLELGKARYSKATYGGFRKWFETTLLNMGGINPNIVEKLMGHKNDLRGTYYNPDLETRFKEFKKAIVNLTISDVLRQDIQLKQQREEIEKKTDLQSQISKLTDKIKRLEDMKN